MDNTSGLALHVSTASPGSLPIPPCFTYLGIQCSLPPVCPSDGDEREPFVYLFPIPTSLVDHARCQENGRGKGLQGCIHGFCTCIIIDGRGERDHAGQVIHGTWHLVSDGGNIR